MSELSEELNKGLSNNPSKSLHARISFLGLLGWLLFVVAILAFVLQSIVFAHKPDPILTADPETGVINGEVVFDAVSVRSNEIIVKDLKAWVSARLSLNSTTIMDDALIALNHMCSDLQNTTYAEWIDTAYLATIEATKGVAKVEFNDDEFALNRDRIGGGYTAVISGNYIIGVGNPVRRGWRIQISGDLFPKTQNLPLGLKVCTYEDI